MATQTRGEETRSRILAAAVREFADQGYEGTAVVDICRRAGVSKGAFYHHFSSKQELFLELLERWLSSIDTRLAELQSDPKPVPEQLMTMTEMICHVFDAAGDQLPMFLEFWAQAAHDSQVWEATMSPYRQYRSFFSRMVQAGVAEGSLRPIDPDTTATVIVSLALGMVLQGLLETKGADWGEITRAGMQMLLDGIARDGQA